MHAAGGSSSAGLTAVSASVAALASCYACCWRTPHIDVEESGKRLAAAVLGSAVVQDAAAKSLVHVLVSASESAVHPHMLKAVLVGSECWMYQEHQSVHDGCARLVQAVLADTRTVRAGQDWVADTVTGVTPACSPSRVPPSSPDSSRLSQDHVSAVFDCSLDERLDEKSKSDISRRASEIIADIVSSPAMEHELQRVLRSTLRAPAVQEAAADAVGGIGRLTAAAAAQALLPWRWWGKDGDISSIEMNDQADHSL